MVLCTSKKIEAKKAMDYSAQYQQKQQTSQPAVDPSQQIQAAAVYDQSSANAQYYQYNPQDYNQQQYDPNYYYPQQQDYSHYYAFQQQQQQQQHSEPASIYPPGVPIPPNPSSDPSYAPTQPQSQPQYPYYPPQQNQAKYGEVMGTTVARPNVSHTPATVQPPYRGRGRRGGRSGRGSGRGHAGGRAEDQQKLSQGASQIQVKPSSSVSGKPPRTAWCELCKVECNTPEILEIHMNGKKHKKNLKNSGQLHKLNKSEQTSIPPAVEQLPQAHLPCQIVTGDTQVQPQENSVIEEGSGKQKVDEVAPVEEGRGVKRMIRGGRGGKLMKLNNGSRKAGVGGPAKAPKKMVPLICELCNVTCESVVVFQSHLAGKKHLTNLQDFQQQQAMLGQAALQALYPALQALQALCQPNGGASTSMAQPNLPELLGILAQQALSTIPQDQVPLLLPPPSGLVLEEQQGSILPSEEARENAAADEPLKFVTSMDGAVNAAAAISAPNCEVVPPDSTANSELDGKQAD